MGIETLWWVLFAVCSAIFLAFCALLLYAVRPRAGGGDDEGSTVEGPGSERSSRDRAPARWVVIGGLLVPAVIVTGLFGLTAGTLRRVVSADSRPRVLVHVAGERWWWRVRYVEHAGAPADSGTGVVTANEIHIPVGEPVELRLTSSNVIHSFWVPQLHGKVDVVPGNVNVVQIQADRPGVYRGRCAEYCGIQHANMGLLVIAEPRAAFESWLERQRRPANPAGAGAAAPSGEEASRVARGRATFNEKCARCHTVRGTGAEGTEGPDLTHVASRRTLGAGTRPMTQSDLAAWILRSQDVKPGNLMPSLLLEPEELHGVVAYLMSLQ